MQNKNTSKSINTFWKKADEIGSIEVDIPEPFENEDDRQLWRAFLKRKQAWTHSPEFDPFANYDWQYERDHGVI